MGLFKRKSKARDAPKVQDRTAGSGFSFYMGNSSSGKPVTERSAMQMTAVYACVRILSEAVAGLPLHFYRYRPEGSEKGLLYVSFLSEKFVENFYAIPLKRLTRFNNGVIITSLLRRQQ